MLQVGIVGLPNVGKSTLFNAILKREQALSANYPFATIEPNIGIVEVIDSRLNQLQKIVKENTGIKAPIVYSAIEMVDIAGLVEGANKGEGLGNQFLANIREVDMILHVVRDFSDENIIKEHSKNPHSDTDIINNELILKDIESIQKRIQSFGKDNTKDKEKQILEQYLAHLDAGGFAIELRVNEDFPLQKGSYKVSLEDWNDFIKPMFLLTDKKMVYVFNTDLSKPGLDKDLYKGKKAINISAKFESELASLSTEDQKLFLQEANIKESGLDKVTRMCFEMLGLISYFTAGEKEVRAWEVKKGSTAPIAAGKIHTDFEKNFIKAEVLAFEDYIQHKGRVGAKNKGKLRLEGKEYIVKDGDVIEFKIGA
jgi:hypothetical protein